METQINKKLFVFDIDGTILNDEKQVLDSTKQALFQLKKDGHYLAFATGRTPFQAFKLAKELNFDYIIGTNGTSIYNLKTKKYLTSQSNYLPIESILYLLKIAKDNKREFFFSDGKKNWRTYFGDDPKKEIKDISFFKNGSSLKYKYSNWNEIKNFIYEKKIVQANIKMETDLVKKHLPKVEQDLKNKVSVCESSRILIEINGLNQNKYEGIKKIQEILKISNDNIYCFGDSHNDEIMLLNVKNGIAMGNAIESLKNKCKKITDSNNNDGIYKFLKQNELI